MSSFVWERGPFSKCDQCLQETIGLLNVGGDHYTMRCSNCRSSFKVPLPKLNKKVIYLDQFAFSLLFNVETGGKLPKGHEDVSVELHQRLRRLVHFQQILLPHSNIHHEETIVFRRSVDLRQAYEFIGGDARLIDTREVELAQTVAGAKAYIEQKPLELNLSIDEIIEGERNEWLPLMHISVRSDYSSFADELRTERDAINTDFERLADVWKASRPTFSEVLANEMAAIRKSKINALVRTEAARQSSDPAQVLGAWGAPIQIEVRNLLHLFRDCGVPEDRCGSLVKEYWDSDYCKMLPHHKISSYLFAAIARRIVSGQRIEMLKGMMNDVRAISSYAPYVDAMFIDKTCANLLSELPLSRDLQYKAKIFSLGEPQSFLDYLDGIERETPEKVQSHAARFYGAT